MLNRFAPLVPLALVTLLFGCAAQMPASQQQSQNPHIKDSATAQSASHSGYSSSVLDDEIATEDELAQFSDNKPYQLPVLADSILERGKSLIGTRYRFGAPRPLPVSIAAVSSVTCSVKKPA